MTATTNTAPGSAGQNGAHTPGPWEYVPSTEHHGPYVTNQWGGDICDCYAMSNPASLSVRNGGDSRPIHFQHEAADANARLIAAAPQMLEALRLVSDRLPNFPDPDAVEEDDIAEVSISLADWRVIRAAVAAATGEAV